jgi:hypothetical protein
MQTRTFKNNMDKKIKLRNFKFFIYTQNNLNKIACVSMGEKWDLNSLVVFERNMHLERDLYFLDSAEDKEFFPVKINVSKGRFGPRAIKTNI